MAEGKTPDVIAAERGLAIGTIYSHLAQLIAGGQVNINRVVPQALQNQIRAAINAVGSAQYLAPIKARLPEDIDYNLIRCVTNAWLFEHGQTPPAPSASTPKPAAFKTPQERPTEDAVLFQKLRAWRFETSRQENVPPYVVFPDETLHELASFKPKTSSALLQIKGIGPTRAEKYGVAVLALIAHS